MADAPTYKYADGYLSSEIDVGSFDWKQVETGPGNPSKYVSPTSIISPARIRVRKQTSTVIKTWGKIGDSNTVVKPPEELTPQFWSNFKDSDDFPLRTNTSTEPARIAWAGVYPNNLSLLVVVWDAPVILLDRSKITVATKAVPEEGPEVVKDATKTVQVSSIEGRVMYLKLPYKVNIDGSVSDTDDSRPFVTFKPGSVAVVTQVKDLNVKMYGDAPTSDKLLAADTFNDTTDIAGLQTSDTYNQFIPAVYGTVADITIPAQCWQQFEMIAAKKICSNEEPVVTKDIPMWAMCYEMWGTTEPQDQFPPEDLFQLRYTGGTNITDLPDLTCTYAARLEVDLTATEATYPPISIIGAAGQPIALNNNTEASPDTFKITYDVLPGNSMSDNQLPAGTVIQVNLCGVSTITGNSSEVTGSGETTAVAVVYGGNCLEKTAPFSTSKQSIFNLARFPKPLDPAKPEDWRKLDLPLAFKHGDPIPQRQSPASNVVTPTEAKWPNGLGIARLCRPHILGNSRWDADIDTSTPLSAIPSNWVNTSENTGDVPWPAYVKYGYSNDEIHVFMWLDKPLPTDFAVDTAKITTTIQSAASEPCVVTGITQSVSCLTLTLDVAFNAASLAMDVINRTITFAAGALQLAVVTNSDGTTSPVYNTAFTATVLADLESGGTAFTSFATGVPVTIRQAVLDPAVSTSSLKVYFSGLLSAAPALTITGAPTAITAATPVNNGSGVFTYTLSRAIVDEDLSSTITLATDNTGYTPVQDALPSSSTVPGSISTANSFFILAPARCYVTVINRYTEQNYTYGVVIDVSSTGTDIQDKQTPINTRTCYDSRIRERYADTLTMCTTGTGNLLQAVGGVNYYGCKKPTSTIVSVPTLVPGLADGSLPAGLSWANVYLPGSGTVKAWMALSVQPSEWVDGTLTARTQTYQYYFGALPTGTTFLARGFVLVPVAGSPGVYANVYLPSYL